MSLFHIYTQTQLKTNTFQTISGSIRARTDSQLIPSRDPQEKEAIKEVEETLLEF